jgi:hypothetical protein
MRIELGHVASFELAPSEPKPARSFRASLGESRLLSAHRAQALLGGAWSTVVGRAPSPRAVAILTAHWALETDGGRWMPSHNFAGIKAEPSAPGAELPTVEGHGAERREVIARFRVYDNAQAGARDYVHLLAMRYPAALTARVSPPGALAQLALGGILHALQAPAEDS